MQKANILDCIVDYKDLQKLSINNLQNLTIELQQLIINTVKKTGGHLGSPLGTIELTLALLKTFNLPNDKIIWDIGHQSYAYKILTNRKDNFSTLRQDNGISGFSNPLENEFDLFTGGHCSTSISTAMGLNAGLNLQNKNQYAITVIGDASIGAGVAFEALNHLGSTKYNNIVVLNDNQMSISKTVGALDNYLAKITSSIPFLKIKRIADKVANKIDNAGITFLQNKLEGLLKTNIEANFFTDMGMYYIGPIDGHDIELLIKILENIKEANLKQPILLHILTKKGNGYNVENPKDHHGFSPKTIINEDILENQVKLKESNTKIFSNTLINIANNETKIVAITAAMPSGTGLDTFAKAHKDKFFDVGIAEQHAVAFACGLAKAGLKPFVAIYSTFLQRAYDQIIHDVSIENLPVRFVLDRAGFVGADGPTHAGLFDYSMLVVVPNMIVMAPLCSRDLTQMISLMANLNNNSSSIRFNKDSAIDFDMLHKFNLVNCTYNDVKLSKGQIIKQGSGDIAIIGLGQILLQALLSAEDLKKQHNIDITVANIRFLKPIDEELIIDLANKHKYIITLEEGIGNVLGNEVLQVLIKNNLLHKIIFKNIFVPSLHINHGGISNQNNTANISSQKISNFILKLK
jgi:1-deoxy-D-xylulose-5-phosphate synthase